MGMASRNKRARRRALLAEYGPYCCWCYQEFPPEELTLEHLVPRFAGGVHARENLMLACYPCNHGRHNRIG